MKYLKVNPEVCIGCQACSEACAELFFKEKSIEKSCIRIVESVASLVPNDKEKGFDIIVCNQCGKCIPLCPTQALSVNSVGVVMLVKKDCSGCLICVAECPCGCMHYLVEENAPFKCTACGVCVKKCPVNALEIVNQVGTHLCCPIKE